MGDDDGQAVAMTEEENRLQYEAKGSPLFGKLWTYEELLSAERPTRIGKKKPMGDMQTPECWPKDTVIDNKSTWVFWLPEGWKQGIRTSIAGKILKCWFNPANKRFWHKKDIESHLGYALPTVEPPAPKEDGEKAKPRVKYVTDADCIPGWPEDEGDWLPKDFKIAFRQLPSGPHRIYIPPGKEDEGFLYHRSLVGEWLSGEKTTLSSFGNSKPMANISAAALQRGTSKAQKRNHNKQASPEDYEPCPDFLVQRLPSNPDDTPTPTGVPAEMKREAAEIRKLLTESGFDEGTELVAILPRSAAEPSPSMMSMVAGLYYRFPHQFNKRPFFQHVGLTGSQLACKGAYVFWNSSRSCWQVGALDEDKAGFAVVNEDCGMPHEAGQPWKLLKDSFWRGEDAQGKTETSQEEASQSKAQTSNSQAEAE